MKRRLVLGLPIFFIAFVTGYMLVPELPNSAANEPTNEQVTKPSEQLYTQQIDSGQPLSTQTAEFVAEFRDLPNFEEIDYSNSNAKLIDVLEHEGVYRESEVVARSGERWLGLFELGGEYSLKYADAKVKTNANE